MRKFALERLAGYNIISRWRLDFAGNAQVKAFVAHKKRKS